MGRVEWNSAHIIERRRSNFYIERINIPTDVCLWYLIVRASFCNHCIMNQNRKQTKGQMGICEEKKRERGRDKKNKRK